MGGDGTFNQMVNGMLARSDKKTIPVGLIPTGQSNDMARSLGLAVEGTLHALEVIAKGETITIDTTRVLLDHDSEKTLPAGIDRLHFCRHMMSNSMLSMPAKIANGAETLKGCFGSSSYSLSTYFQAFSCGFVADTYSLTIDDVAFNQGSLNTALMMVNNGKYANGGMIMNPFAAINDGLIDITWISDPSYSGTLGVTGIFSDAGGGAGIQAYRGHSQYVRGKKIRIEVPQQEPEQAQPELEFTDGDEAATTPSEPVKQVCMIDGEPLSYERSITWECFPGNLEILFDDSYFTQNQTFSRKLTAEVERDRSIM